MGYLFYMSEKDIFLGRNNFFEFVKDVCVTATECAYSITSVNSILQ